MQNQSNVNITDNQNNQDSQTQEIQDSKREFYQQNNDGILISDQQRLQRSASPQFRAQSPVIVQSRQQLGQKVSQSPNSLVKASFQKQRSPQEQQNVIYYASQSPPRQYYSSVGRGQISNTIVQNQRFLEQRPNSLINFETQKQIPIQQQAQIRTNYFENSKQIPLQQSGQIQTHYIESQQQIPIQTQAQIPIQTQVQIPIQTQAQIPIQAQTQIQSHYIENSKQIPIQQQAQIQTHYIQSQKQIPIQPQAQFQTHYITTQPIIHKQAAQQSYVISQPQIQQQHYVSSVTENTGKISELELEIERLNYIIQEKNDEVESWKGKCSHLEMHIGENSGQKELEKKFMMLLEDNRQLNEIIKQIEAEREHDKQRAEKSKKSAANQDAQLREELEKMDQILQQKETEIMEFKNRIMQFEFRLKDVDSQKTLVLQLQEDLQMRIRECEDWRMKFSTIENKFEGKIREQDLKIKTLMDEVERSRLSCQQYQEEINIWQVRFGKTQEELRDASSWKFKCQDLEKQIGYLQEEISRINGLNDETRERTKRSHLGEKEMLQQQIETLRIDLDSWKSKYSKLEIQIYQQGQWESKCRDLESMLKIRSTELNEYKSKCSQLEIKISELSSLQIKISEYEQQLAMLSKEINRLNEIINQLQKENYELIERLKDFDSHKTHSERVKRSAQNEKEQLIRTIQELEQRNAILLKELDEMRSAYSKLENQIREMRLFEEKIKSYELHIQSLEEKISLMIRELDQWRSKCQGYEIRINEIDQLREMNENLKRNAASEREMFQIRIREMEEKLNQLLLELNQWKDKYQKLELSLRDINAYQEQIKYLEGHIGQLEQKIMSLMKDLDEYKSRNTKLEIQLRELSVYEEKLRVKDGLIRQLEEKINFQINQFEELSKKCREQEITINELRNYEYQLVQYQNQIKDYEQRFQALIKELEQWKQRCQEYELRLREIDEHRQNAERVKRSAAYDKEQYQIQIRELEERIQILLRELDEWKSRYSKLEINVSNISIYDQKVRQQEQIIVELQDKITVLLKDLDQWKSKYSSLEIQIYEIEQHKQNTERVKRSAAQDKEGYLRQIRDLEQRIQILLQEQDEWKGKYQSLNVTVSNIQVYESKMKQQDQIIAELQSKLQNSYGEIDQWKSRFSQIEIKLYEIDHHKENAEKVKRSAAQEKEGYLRYIKELEEKNQILSRDVENWQGKYSSMQVTVNSVTIYESKMKQQDQIIVELQEKMQVIYRDIDQWKKRCSEYELRLREIDEHKQNTERVKRSAAFEREQYQRQIREQDEKLQILLKELEEWKGKYSSLQINMSNISIYEQKAKNQDQVIHELQDKVQILLREIDQWKSKYSQIEIQIYEIEQHKQNAERVKRSAAKDQEGFRIQIKQLEEKILILVKDADQWKSKYSQLEMGQFQINSLKDRNEQLEIKLQNQIKDYENLKSQYQTLEMNLFKLKSSESIIKDSEAKIVYLTSEINRLQTVITSLNKDIQEWQSRCKSLEQSIHQMEIDKSQNETMRSSFTYEKSNLLKQLDSLKAELQLKIDKNNQLESQLFQYKQFEYKNQELEKQLVLISQELSKLKDEHSLKIREINELLYKISQLEQSHQHVEHIKKSQVNDRESLNQEISILKQQLESAMQKCQRYELEFSKLGNQKNEIIWLTEEVQRLSQIQIENEKEIEKWRTQYVQYANLTTRISEHLILFTLLFAEIESLRARVIEKDKEMNEVRKSSIALFSSRKNLS